MRQVGGTKQARRQSADQVAGEVLMRKGLLNTARGQSADQVAGRGKHTFSFFSAVYTVKTCKKTLFILITYKLE